MPIQAIEGGQLRFLSKRDLNKVHQATLDVLEKYGVVVHEQTALRILDEAGAKVNYRDEVVNIPGYLVEDTVKKAPGSVTLCGRNPDHDVILEGRKVYTAGGADAIYVVDLETHERRPASLRDLQDLTRLQDALSNIHVVMGIIDPRDVPPVGVDRLRYLELVKNTGKHVMRDAQGRQGARDQIEMAAAVVGGEEELEKRPIISFVDCTTSPLKHGKTNTELLIEAAKHRIPVFIECDAMAGASTPVTLAGTLVVQNAEVLSGILISQLVNPGTPIIYGNMSSIMDMKSANIALGAPELGLIQVAAAQLAQYYGVPFQGCGGMTDSKICDAQASLEKTLTLMQAALAGANLVHEMAGMLDSLFTVSYEQVVIDNEIMGAVYRTLKGVEVTDDTLAIDVIGEVGPLGSHFLAKEHTRRFMRQEHWMPEILSRERRESWEKKGSRQIEEVAREKCKKILKEHWPEPLEKETLEAIEGVVKRTKQQ